MKNRISNFYQKLKNLAGHKWYPFLIAFLAALDAFIFIVPIEPLVLAGVLAQRKRWAYIALTIALGSALGAVILAAAIETYGESIIMQWMPEIFHSANWIKSEALFKKHGGWALPLISVSPFPQQPAVALAGLLHFNLGMVFGSVILGRGVKYLFFSWSVSHARKILKKPRLFSSSSL